jgi:hypothetical protein
MHSWVKIKQQGLGTPSLSRASTPAPPSEAPSVESNAADDALLRQLAAVIVDLNQLRSHILAMWRDEISMMLPDTSSAEDPENVKAEGKMFLFY